MSLNHGRSAVAGSESQGRVGQIPRLFVFDLEWQVEVKRGASREFCHIMAPGQDYYHRLLDGEIYLRSKDEKICLNCAARRGIISFEARKLRNPIDFDLADSAELDVYDPPSDLL
jgi:hypothetical protein